MTRSDERAAAVQPLLQWIHTNFPLNVEVPIDRQEIALRSGVDINYVQKSMAVLVNKGFIKYTQRRGQPSVNELVKPIAEVTGKVLSNWITEYQSSSDARRKERLQKKAIAFTSTENPALATEQNVTRLESTFKQAEPVVSSQPELPLTPAREFSMTAEPDEPLSPAQRLLKQAQELVEAENRLKAEQEEQAGKVANLGTNDELLMLLDNRIDSIEGKVNVVLNFFQQAYQTLQGLAPVGSGVATEEPAPAEPTTRMLLVRLVNSYSAAERKTEHETWKYLYGQLDMRTGVNAYAQAAPNKVRDQSYLAVIEKQGQLETLYTLAKKLLVLPELN